MPLNSADIIKLGWNDFFSDQLTDDEHETALACRVMSAHRGHLTVSSGKAEISLPETLAMQQQQGEKQITVGDWLVLNADSKTLIRPLKRSSLIQRQMVGFVDVAQVMAANVDVLFIVTSANDDFQLSRLERYLALAYGAGVTPVIVLTKQDLLADSDALEAYKNQAQALDQKVPVISVNGRDPASTAQLHPWCQAGRTVALVGSSGVGKSTLVNGLGAEIQKTGAIREDDARGRHTTTHRSLLPLSSGAVLLDSPGIRGVSLVPGDGGVETVFSDVITLSQQCRFRNCQHEAEPDCAIKGALEDGSLTQRRLDNYNKLVAEQTHRTARIPRKNIDNKKGKWSGKHRK